MSTVIDYGAQAKKLLVSQFGNAEQFKKMLVIMLGPFQEIEYELQRLMYLRSITLADGAQLDRLGADLDLPRGGLTDALYRDALNLRIRRNVNNASPDQIIEYARILGSATIIEYIEGVASYFLSHNGDPTKLTQAALEDITAAGVGVGVGVYIPPEEDFGVFSFTQEEYTEGFVEVQRIGGTVGEQMVDLFNALDELIETLIFADGEGGVQVVAVPDGSVYLANPRPDAGLGTITSAIVSHEENPPLPLDLFLFDGLTPNYWPEPGVSGSSTSTGEATREFLTPYGPYYVETIYKAFEVPNHNGDPGTYVLASKINDSFTGDYAKIEGTFEVAETLFVSGIAAPSGAFDALLLPDGVRIGVISDFENSRYKIGFALDGVMYWRDATDTWNADFAEAAWIPTGGTAQKFTATVNAPFPYQNYGTEAEMTLVPYADDQMYRPFGYEAPYPGIGPAVGGVTLKGYAQPLSAQDAEFIVVDGTNFPIAALGTGMPNEAYALDHPPYEWPGTASRNLVVAGGSPALFLDPLLVENGKYYEFRILRPAALQPDAGSVDTTRFNLYGIGQINLDFYTTDNKFLINAFINTESQFYQVAGTGGSDDAPGDYFTLGVYVYANGAAKFFLKNIVGDEVEGGGWLRNYEGVLFNQDGFGSADKFQLFFNAP